MWNAAIINTSEFPAVACQNVFYEARLNLRQNCFQSEGCPVSVALDHVYI